LCCAETIQDPFQTHSTWPNLNKVQDVHNVHIEEGEDATPSHESCSFLPYHPFSCEEEGVVTNMFLNESFVDLSTFMNNKESCCCSNQLVEIEANKCNETNNVSGFHLYIDDISSRMVRNSKFTSFSHNIPSQVVGYVKYDPRETFQNNEALWFRPMVMSALIIFFFLWN
jgi:hypothetical protein